MYTLENVTTENKICDIQQKVETKNKPMLLKYEDIINLFLQIKNCCNNHVRFNLRLYMDLKIPV